MRYPCIGVRRPSALRRFNSPERQLLHLRKLWRIIRPPLGPAGRPRDLPGIGPPDRNKHGGGAERTILRKNTTGDGHSSGLASFIWSNRDAADVWMDYNEWSKMLHLPPPIVTSPGPGELTKRTLALSITYSAGCTYI